MKKFLIKYKGLMIASVFLVTLMISLGIFFLNKIEIKNIQNFAPYPTMQDINGKDIPKVNVVPKNSRLPTLQQVLYKNENSLLLDYVKGYLIKAQELKLDTAILTENKKIQYVKYNKETGVQESTQIDWNENFSTGIELKRLQDNYDKAYMDKLAYAIMMYWTQTNDHIEASKMIVGEHINVEYAYPIAINSIHRQLLSSVFMPDFYDVKLIDINKDIEQERILNAKNPEKILRKILIYNTGKVTEYLNNKKKTSMEDANIHAFYLIHYYVDKFVKNNDQVISEINRKKLMFEDFVKRREEANKNNFYKESLGLEKEKTTTEQRRSRYGSHLE